jgi:hypothetical protein
LLGIQDKISTSNSNLEDLFNQLKVCSSSAKRDNDFLGKIVFSLKSKYFLLVVLSKRGKKNDGLS